MTKLATMTATDPRVLEAAELHELLDDCPGCEISGDENPEECCGSPAVAYALFEIVHAFFCNDWQANRLTAWVCGFHLRVARKGRLTCCGCGRLLTLIQVL